MAYSAFKARGLFYIQLDPDYQLEVIGKDKAAARKAIGDFTDKWGETVATKAKDRMAAVLAKGHRFKVGATGGASENFALDHTGAGTPNSTWVVMEAGKTKANYFIRYGFGGVKPGRNIPPANLKEWAAAKGVRLHLGNYDTNKKAGAGYKRTRASAKRRSYLVPVLHSTGMVGGKSIAERAIKRLQFWLGNFGSEMSHWNRLHPVGRPYFDYVSYTIRQDKMWGQAVAKSGELTGRAIVDWLTSGRTPSSGRIYRV